MWTASSHLFLLTLRRQLLSRQTIACAALTLVCALIVMAWSRQPDPTLKTLAEHVLVPTYLVFLVPIFAICYGASGIGHEREEQTLIYLLLTPLQRPVVYLVKAAAGLGLAAVWTAGTLLILCGLAGPEAAALVPVFLPGALLGVLAYAALFLLVGAIFRHGMIMCLVYWFFLEVLFGNMPGIIKRVSVAFYVRCVIYESGAEYELGPVSRVAREMFLPVSSMTAILVLSVGTVVLLTLGAAGFEVREYRDA